MLLATANHKMQKEYFNLITLESVHRTVSGSVMSFFTTFLIKETLHMKQSKRSPRYFIVFEIK